MNTSCKLPFLLAVLFIPFTLSSQNKTYKVVCDKNDKKLKVVEAENRSSNLVPIKSGFPFPAIARQWITDNYATDDCDPGQITSNIQNEKPPQTQQQSTIAPQPPTQNQTKTVTPPKKADRFRNTSFGMDLLLSDYGRYLGLSENPVLGMKMDLERVFGKQIFFGTGIHFSIFSSAITSSNDEEDPIGLYTFKIPFFMGARIKYFSFDGGVAFNTKVKEIGSETDFWGITPESSSLNFLLRAKVGGKYIQFEMGGDLWLSDVFESQQDKKLSIFYIGYRCFF